MNMRLLAFLALFIGVTTFSFAQEEESEEGEVIRLDSISRVEQVEREAKEIRKQIEAAEKEAKKLKKRLKQQKKNKVSLKRRKKSTKS